MSFQSMSANHEQLPPPGPRPVFVNKRLADSQHTTTCCVGKAKQSDRSSIRNFHATLPNYAATPLIDLPDLAAGVGVARCLVKVESSRLGLPAFKILGASWGAYRALCDYFMVSESELDSLDELRTLASEAPDPVILCAATDGNHGRAVARIARLVLLSDESRAILENGGTISAKDQRAVIYVPQCMYEETKQLIRDEGALVKVVDGDYDQTVMQCFREQTVNSVMVQDNAFMYIADGAMKMYEQVPRWIVEGYGTLFHEIDDQLRRATHVVTPIGVGSLGHAVVNWAKSKSPSIKVIAVEPARAGCLYASLQAGKSVVVSTEDTIMSGMCCGTVSPISWEALHSGIDASVVLSEWEAHQAVVQLQEQNIAAGPCGAATLAGLEKIIQDPKSRDSLELDENAVVVLLCTEGTRQYPIPDMDT